MKTFTEDTRVKIPALLHLTRLGYSYLSLKKARWDEATNIFTDIFRESLARINQDAAAEDTRQSRPLVHAPRDPIRMPRFGGGGGFSGPARNLPEKFLLANPACGRTRGLLVLLERFVHADEGAADCGWNERSGWEKDRINAAALRRLLEIKRGGGKAG